MYFIAHTIHRAYGQQITTDGSYSIFVIFFYFAGIEGFEPTTNRLTVRSSNQIELYPQRGGDGYRTHVLISDNYTNYI